MRSRGISLLRATLRQEGWRLPGGSPDAIERRVETLALPRALVTTLAPLRTWLSELTSLLKAADAAVEDLATSDPVAQNLMTAPGVGPVVALTFAAVLDDPTRFAGDAARASAFLGLVPSEDSSAERRLKGAITKTGPADLRALLVQASWTIWRGRSAAGAELRTWAHALAKRRGRRIAIVALARRVSRILFAMWRDQTAFGVKGQRPIIAA